MAGAFPGTAVPSCRCQIIYTPLQVVMGNPPHLQGGRQVARRRKFRREIVQKPESGNSTVRIWAIAVSLGVVVTWVISNAPAIIEFPSQVSTGLGSLKGWYYEDLEWTGLWDTFPEGDADMEIMRLTDPYVAIYLKAEGGKLSGTIGAESFCGPLTSFHFVDGEVSSAREAEIVVWDFHLGARRDFVRLRLNRIGRVLEVRPFFGAKHLLPEYSRLARFPGSESREEVVAEYGDCASLDSAFRKR